MDKIKTSKLAAFINTTPNAEETYSRIRKQGELKLAYNAETSEEGYIDQDSKDTNTDSYSVGFDGELIAHTGDPVFEYLDGLRQNRAVNADAETEVIIVNMYDGDEGNYSAEKNRCSIQIGDFGGEGGGGNLSLNYTCSFNGDPIKGTATVVDGKVTFTAAKN
ncbi:MAG: hypothetical protein NC397_08945 [Clostridium sp.]|nr:hypothetical protein [Clostridium sp.]